MKKLKLSRKVQITLITIFILTVGIIVACIMTNNKVSAATKPCGDSNCSGTMTCRNSGTGTHRWHCNICSYIEQGSCSGGSWIHKGGTSVHQKFCWACGYYYAQENCYDDNGDGSCDTGCGNTGMHTHSYSETSYTQNDGTTHNIIKRCSCGATQNAGTEAHTFGASTDNGDGRHSSTCSKCNYKKTEEHKGATHENGGKCTVCGAKYENHSQSNTLKEYTKTGTTHTPVYTCTQSGCTQTYTGTPENHKGATHENGGKCTVCQQQYETHGKSSTIKEYTKTGTTHTPIYTCTQSGCKQTYTGTPENHKGATHENGGECTVCQQQYETHSKSETIKEYTKTENGHTPIYACTHSGCSETYDGTESSHEGATHINGGKCTVCQYQYEVHSKSNKIKEYTKTETGHIPMYECTHQGCTQTYAGIPENHTGATHENEGKCTVCQQQYETHGKSETIKEYIKTETTHTPVYKCLHEGCTETYQGTAEPHKNETYTDNGDGTHSSTCTECGGVTTENHNFEDGTCTDCQSKEPDIETGSDKYEFLEGNVTNIQPHTEVSVFKQNLQTNATEINIYNLENKLLEDTEIVATGMKLELKKGKQIKTFTLIVRGDVNGDGEADFKDITKINQVRLNKETLEKIHSIAAEVTGDGEVDFKDIVKINRFRLSKIKEL